jgi:DNA-binding transcriptional LysR family regulator
VLEIRLLAALTAVVDEGTFSAAAARLGYTQSTLSQQVAALERAVRGRVLDRRSGARAAELTPLGRVVLEHARDLTGRVDEAEAAIARFHAGDGRVDIGTFQTVTHVLLPGILRQLREERPTADVRLFEDETPQPRLDGLDLVFFDAPPASGVHGRLILTDDHVLIAPPGMFPPGPVSLGTLDARPMVALPPICDQGLVEARLAAADVAPVVVFRTADNHGVVAMVRAGLGCAVMPVLAIGPAGDVSVHPLPGSFPPREIHVHWQGSLSPLARRVVDLAGRQVRTIRTDGVRAGSISE